MRWQRFLLPCKRSDTFPFLAALAQVKDASFLLISLIVEWCSHYAMLNGDGQIVWGRKHRHSFHTSLNVWNLFFFCSADPELTALGESQARILNSLWKTEMAAGIPVPQKGYCSPLTRAMRTAVISLDGVILNTHEIVVVVEVRFL